MSARTLWQLIFTVSLLLVAVIFVALKFDYIKSHYSRIRSDFYIMQAREALQEEKLPAARILLQNAYRHTPERTEILDLFVELFQKEDNPNLLPLLIHKQMAAPTLKNALLLLETALKTQQHVSALPLLQQITSSNPQNIEVLRLCSNIYRDLQFLPLAEQCLQEALVIDPKNVKLRVELAILHLKHPDKTTSESAREYLKKIEQEDNDLQYKVARALADDAAVRNSIEALRKYQMILERYPDDWESRIRAFEISAGIEPDSARQEMEKVWSLAKKRQEKQQFLMAILRAYGVKEVLNCATKLSDDEISSPEIRTIFLRALWEEGRYTEATQLAKREYKHETTTLQKALLKYWTFKLASITDDKILADRSLRALEEIISEDQFIAIIFSNELMATGQEELAVSFLEKAANGKQAGFSIMAMDGLFNHYKSKSNLEGLIRVHENLLKLQPENPYLRSNLSALLVLSQKDMARALNLAESAYFMLPTNSAIVGNYAHILALTGKHAEALKLLESIPLESYTEGVKLQKAHALYLSGKTKEAAAFAENINPGEFLKQELEILKKILASENSVQ